MLSECQKQGIHVLLIYMPESSELRSHHSSLAMADVRCYLDSLHRDWQVPVVFAQDWMPDSSFMDACHLYEDSAIEFTSRLCQECLLPYMKVSSLHERVPEGVAAGAQE
jgi:hypothetical protein